MIFNATSGAASFNRNGEVKSIEEKNNKNHFDEFEFSALLVS